MPSGYGKEFTISSFQVGTTYIDSASIVIWIENQVSLGYGETIMGKLKFEEWLWNQAADEIKHLHGDNGIFTSDIFKKIARRNFTLRVFNKYYLNCILILCIKLLPTSKL